MKTGITGTSIRIGKTRAKLTKIKMDMLEEAGRKLVVTAQVNMVVDTGMALSAFALLARRVNAVFAINPKRKPDNVGRAQERSPARGERTSEFEFKTVGAVSFFTWGSTNFVTFGRSGQYHGFKGANEFDRTRADRTPWNVQDKAIASITKVFRDNLNLTRSAVVVALTTSIKRTNRSY